MLELDVRVRTRAGQERVWTVLSNSQTWAEWAPFDEIAVESGHQLGEVRRVRSGPITTRERVVGFEPPHRYVYEIISGLPVRHYLAEVVLTPSAGAGTDIRWRAQFEPTLPGTGWLVKLLLSSAIKRAARALAARADALS
ncbi:MAG: SRPBCC family protein [Mycetocola sp.]